MTKDKDAICPNCGKLHAPHTDFGEFCSLKCIEAELRKPYTVPPAKKGKTK